MNLKLLNLLKVQKDIYDVMNKKIQKLVIRTNDNNLSSISMAKKLEFKQIENFIKEKQICLIKQV